MTRDEILQTYAPRLAAQMRADDVERTYREPMPPEPEPAADRALNAELGELVALCRRALGDPAA